MTKKMIIDATQPEETRVAVLNKDRLESYDFDSVARKQIKGNIFLAKVTRVEPSLQACFVEYGGNRQGFLAFSEIHPDYYRIPVEDREALLAEEARWEDEDEDHDVAAHEAAEVAHAELVEPDAPLAGDETTPIDVIEPIDMDDTPVTPMENLSVALDSLMPESVTSDLIEAEGDIDLPVAANMTEVPRDNTTERIGGAAEEEVEQDQRARRFSRMRRRYKVQEVIKRRQIMLVQATKDERGQKGAAMTTYISLPGRYCVLMPNSPRGGGVSRKITDPQVRRKMKELLAEMAVPEGMSVILRTAGMTRTRTEIKRDLEYLMRLWDEIRRETMQSVAPALIYEEADIFKRAIRDLYSSDMTEIHVAGQEGYKKVKTFMHQMVPSSARRVHFYRDPLVPIFQRYSIERQMTDIFNPRVELRSGGYIIINPTEALVSIDVNSGRATRERHIDDTALKTNLEAAEEIARQLRLRDLGGLVVIDFIDMESNRHNTKVERRLREAMAEDRARIEIGRISGFGLLELSRQRLHPSLTETHFQPCPHCSGTGLVRTTESAAVVAMRAIEAEAVKGRAAGVIASLPLSVAIYILNHKRADIHRIEEYFGCRVSIRIDDKLMPNDVEIQTEKGTPIPKVKGDHLPIPFIEGLDDVHIPDEDHLNEEPLMSLSDARLDDDRDTVEDGDDDEGAYRGRGRNNRRSRNSRRGRVRRQLEETIPETADPYSNVVSILIAEGAPVGEFDVTTGSNQVTHDAEGDNDRRRNRHRRGRHPYRRNRQGRSQTDLPAEDLTAESTTSSQPVQSEPKPYAGEQEKVSADMSGGDSQNTKRGWWQKLIE